MRKLPELRLLELRLCSVGENDWKELKTALGSVASLRNLRLAFDPSVEVEHRALLLAALESVPLESLALSAQNWKEDCGKALARVLAGKMASTLREFHFDGRQENPSALPAALGACKSLCLLELEGQTISTEVLEAISASPSKDSLSCLRFTNCIFWDVSIEEALASCSALTELSIQRRDVGGGSICPSLANWARKNPAAAERLKVFGFSKSMEGVDEALDLAKAIVKFPQLESLNLRGCLKLVVAIPPILDTLDSVVRVRNLDLSDSAFSADLVEQLAGKLPNLKKLQTLNLSHCGIDSPGAIALARALRNLPFTVVLANNKIGSNGAGAFADAVRKSAQSGETTRLRCLDLSENEIPGVAQEYLCRVRDAHHWFVIKLDKQRLDARY